MFCFFKMRHKHSSETLRVTRCGSVWMRIRTQGCWTLKPLLLLQPLCTQEWPPPGRKRASSSRAVGCGDLLRQMKDPWIKHLLNKVGTVSETPHPTQFRQVLMEPAGQKAGKAAGWVFLQPWAVSRHCSICRVMQQRGLARLPKGLAHTLMLLRIVAAVPLSKALTMGQARWALLSTLHIWFTSPA